MKLLNLVVAGCLLASSQASAMSADGIVTKILQTLTASKNEADMKEKVCKKGNVFSIFEKKGDENTANTATFTARSANGALGDVPVLGPMLHKLCLGVSTYSEDSQFAKKVKARMTAGGFATPEDLMKSDMSEGKSKAKEAACSVLGKIQQPVIQGILSSECKK